MDAKAVREGSITQAAALGCRVSPSLPLLDEPCSLRSIDEIFRRLMCLHVTAACAFGLSRTKAKKWIADEGLEQDLERSERDFVYNGSGLPIGFQVRIEGMWALCWVLGYVERLDFRNTCDGKFVYLLPNLKEGVRGRELRSKAVLRSLDDIAAACDLAYCLHWALVEAQIDGSIYPRNLPPHVIVERRRALEWLCSDDGWDEVEMDT